MRRIKLGSNWVDEDSCYLIAEVGINHNGDISLAKKLINLAKESGFHAVKFQKRTIEVVYSQEELLRSRESVFGTTNADLKYGLEFEREEYVDLKNHCDSIGIDWFASPWDVKSVDFLESLGVIAHKVASACLTDSELLRKLASTEKPIIMSTGMSNLEQVRKALSFFDLEKVILLHCVSTYPAKNEDLNLRVIDTLRNEFDCLVGYSGHEVGILPSVIAFATYKACVIERHITVDRSLWGSDQAASLEPSGMSRLVQYIEESKQIHGNGVKRILEAEVPISDKLRRKTDF